MDVTQYCQATECLQSFLLLLICVHYGRVLLHICSRLLVGNLFVPHAFFPFILLMRSQLELCLRQ